MLIVDIVQTLLNLECPELPDGPGTPLRAVAYSPITAAFATQGYWVQSDLLDKLLGTHLQLWAPLLYVMAVIGGLIGVALGTPPRNYIWFFMGPGIYSWLIGTHIEVKGVRWALPCVSDADTLRKFQSTVWKLAEVGLANSNRARIDTARGMDPGITRSLEPEGTVFVANAFLLFDELVSSSVFGMMRWSGAFNLVSGSSTGGSDTNIPELPSLPAGIPPGVIWSLYADKKWPALEEITAAKADNENFRDAFANFFVMCGDPLRKIFRTEAIMAAGATKGRRIPSSVLKCEAANGDADCSPPWRTYQSASSALSVNWVPYPPSLKNVVDSSLRDVGDWSGDSLNEELTAEYLNCERYLFLLMQSLRIEAAFKYHGLWNSVVPELLPEDIDLSNVSNSSNGYLGEDLLVSTLFYGWDIRKNRSWTNAYIESDSGSLLDINERREFAYNLILLHLFRNEYKMVPEIAKVRETNDEKMTSNVELALKTTQSANKFSELYTWSLMLPYVQGSLLYFLAIAYPFACVLIVVPGWHKSVFTWMSFWAWAKMWDLGFALVKSIERTVWAMTSHGGNVRFLSDRVYQMTEGGGRVVWDMCRGDSDPTCPLPIFKLIPSVGGAPAGIGDFDFDPDGSNYERMLQGMWYLFDQSLLMTKALNLDLANSYYIFIMAGLYMAVPAVTGQLVLGARAGASSMVNSMIGGAASEAGRAASAGVQGDLSMKLRSNAATVKQSSKALAAASEGFAAQAFGYSVKALEEARAGSEAGAANAGIGRAQTQLQNGREWGLALARATGAGLHTVADGVKGYNGIRPAGGDDPNNLTPSGGGSGAGTPTGAKGALWGAAGGAITTAEAGYNAAVGSDFYDAHKELSAQQAGLGIREYQGGANNAQLKTAESNMSQYADFASEQKAWQLQNAFANQVGAWSSALGIQTSNVDPGPKSTNMTGMAMSGMLRAGNESGKDTKAGAPLWWTDWNRNNETGSGHRAGTEGSVNALTQHYCPAATRDSFRTGVGGTSWATSHPLVSGGAPTVANGQAAPDPGKLQMAGNGVARMTSPAADQAPMSGGPSVSPPKAAQQKNP